MVKIINKVVKKIERMNEKSNKTFKIGKICLLNL